MKPPKNRRRTSRETCATCRFFVTQDKTWGCRRYGDYGFQVLIHKVDNYKESPEEWICDRWKKRV